MGKLAVLIGLIGVVWFFLPFLLFRILNIGNITGFLLSVLFVLNGIFSENIILFCKNMWERNAGKAVLIVSGSILIFVVLLAALETGWMIHAANRRPAADADVTLVVLGCRVYGSTPSIMLKERIDAAYANLKEHPERKCVLSGGQGSDEDLSEAECMYRELVFRGIEKERLFLEDQSTSTRENILFSKEVIEENGLSTDIAIVTNEFHEYRAAGIAQEQELECAAVPARTRLLLFPTFYVRELYGILQMWILHG